MPFCFSENAQSQAEQEGKEHDENNFDVDTFVTFHECSRRGYEEHDGDEGEDQPH